jgi:hypothetical protein
LELKVLEIQRISLKNKVKVKNRRKKVRTKVKSVSRKSSIGQYMYVKGEWVSVQTSHDIDLLDIV